MVKRLCHDTVNAHVVLQGYYTMWVGEIWNTTFKERQWGRGRRKPNKRDILLSAKNQERKKKKTSSHSHLSISHGGTVALAAGPSCPRGEITALPSRSAAMLHGKRLGSGWLCPGWQHQPGAAVSLQRLGKRHPRCLHKCFLTNVNSPS